MRPTVARYVAENRRKWHRMEGREPCQALATDSASELPVAGPAESPSARSQGIFVFGPIQIGEVQARSWITGE
jgi:hypothetical protein